MLLCVATFFMGTFFFGSTRTDPNCFVALNITRKCFVGVIFHLVFQKKKSFFVFFFIYDFETHCFSCTGSDEKLCLACVMYFKESSIL